MTDPTTAEKIKVLRNAGLNDDAIGVILSLPTTDVHTVSKNPSSPVVAGGVPPLNWKDWPMGANSWAVVNSGGFFPPQYAVQGDLVYLRGTFNGTGATGPVPAIPAEARPAKRQRIWVNLAQAWTSVDMDTDGVLKSGGGGTPSLAGFTTISVCYPKT
jgi:hypothetical protein